MNGVYSSAVITQNNDVEFGKYATRQGTQSKSRSANAVQASEQTEGSSAIQSPSPDPKKDDDDNDKLSRKDVEAEKIEKSAQYATTKPKLIHFFNKPMHGFDNLLDKWGGKNNINVQKKLVYQVIKKLMKFENLPNTGEFKDIPVSIEGYTIHVRGFMCEGVIKIGTMFIPQ